MKIVDCDWCEGTGNIGNYSCCGDDITGNDIDICPTCGEHCGDEEEICDNCTGTGKINQPETPEEIEAEKQKIQIICDENKKRRDAWRSRVSSV